MLLLVVLALMLSVVVKALIRSMVVRVMMLSVVVKALIRSMVVRVSIPMKYLVVRMHSSGRLIARAR